MTEHHHHGTRHFGKQTNQAIQKSFALQYQQSFGGSHAAGGATGQNNAGDRRGRLHLRSARSDSVAKIDFERARQSVSGARRTAIISATMETAISSGVMAPISSPIGAKTRSNAARAMPSFSNS